MGRGRGVVHAGLGVGWRATGWAGRGAAAANRARGDPARCGRHGEPAQARGRRALALAQAAQVTARQDRPAEPQRVHLLQFYDGNGGFQPQVEIAAGDDVAKTIEVGDFLHGADQPSAIVCSNRKVTHLVVFWACIGVPEHRNICRNDN